MWGGGRISLKKLVALGETLLYTSLTENKLLVPYLWTLSITVALNLGPGTYEAHATTELHPQTRTICIFKKAV